MGLFAFRASIIAARHLLYFQGDDERAYGTGSVPGMLHLANFLVFMSRQCTGAFATAAHLINLPFASRQFAANAVEGTIMQIDSAIRAATVHDFCIGYSLVNKKRGCTHPCR